MGKARTASAAVVITGGMRLRIARAWRSISVPLAVLFVLSGWFPRSFVALVTLQFPSTIPAGAAVGGGTSPGNGDAKATNGPSTGATPRDAAP